MGATSGRNMHFSWSFDQGSMEHKQEITGNEKSEKNIPRAGQALTITPRSRNDAHTQDWPHWAHKEVAQQIMRLPRDGNLGLCSQSAICLFSRVELCPSPTTLFHPSGSYGCTQASQYKLVITTLRIPDQPIAIGAGLPHEKSLVALLTLKNLDYPGWMGYLLEGGFLGVLLHSGWEWTSKHSPNCQHGRSELTWWRNLA